MKYAGIGSRKTPKRILQAMTRIAMQLYDAGYTLRSGAADGADKAFEQGARDHKEIFLPWKGFNGSRSSLFNLSAAAFNLSRRFHPAWESLRDAAKKLMARNAYQVLGLSLDSPVSFIVCWTPGANGSGGTGQALRIAREHGIKIYDLGSLDGIVSIELDLGIDTGLL